MTVVIILLWKISLFTPKSSRRVYNASYAAALIGGEASKSDDEFLVDSDDEDEEYIPPLSWSGWNDEELDNDSSDSGGASYAAIVK